jgi:phosphohistidine phosphatase
MHKTTIIVRHAKSSWIDLSQQDFDRPLDDRGNRDAPAMAAKLKGKGYSPDIFLSSSAMRAKTTAHYFGVEFGMEVMLHKKLYHAEPEVYMDLINDLDESISTCILFGHNPGVTHIANLISEGSTYDLPTCGIIIATTPASVKWSDISWNHMTLVEILTPKNVSY